MADIVKLPPREEQLRRLHEAMRHALGEFCGLLDEDGVTDIILNPDGVLRVYSVTAPPRVAGTMLPTKAETLISIVASMFRTTVTHDNPTLECTLPLDGSRFTAAIPPIGPAATFAIRKHAAKIFSLHEYVDDGIITTHQFDVLSKAVLERQNIVVAGSMGSGKTTMVNSLLDWRAQHQPELRVGIIQDVNELRCASPDHQTFWTSDHRTMTALTRHMMRWNVDVVVIGELRGEEALEFLKLEHSGHPGGITTLHANSAKDALDRLELLLMEATQSPMERLIAGAVNLIVYLEKTTVSKITPKGRTVKEILAIRGFRNGAYETEEMD
jgi:type IV secretion system protein VirB11